MRNISDLAEAERSVMATRARRSAVPAQPTARAARPSSSCGASSTSAPASTRRRHRARRQRRRLRGAADPGQPMERRESGAPGRDHLAASGRASSSSTAALSAGTPPDIVSLHAFRIPAYASKGALTPTHPVPRRGGHRRRRHAGEASRGRDLQRQDLRHSDRRPRGPLAHQPRPVGEGRSRRCGWQADAPEQPRASSRRPARRSRTRAAARSSARATTMSSAPAGCGPASTRNSAARLSTTEGMPSVDTPEALDGASTPC